MLPREITTSPERDRWERAAKHAATIAMGDLVSGDLRASIDNLRAAAKQPVQEIIDKFRHEQRCQKLLDSCWWLRLPDWSAEERQRYRKAVEASLGEQPFTASDNDLAAARDKALAPFRAATDAVRAEQRALAEAEARRIQEQNHRNSLKQSYYLLPFDMPEAVCEQARAAIGRALDEHLEGTPLAILGAARDNALTPYLERHALITHALRGLFTLLLEYESERRLGGRRAETVQRELEPQIRKRLQAELSGQEPQEEAAKLVRRIVRELLGFKRQADAA